MDLQTRLPFLELDVTSARLGAVADNDQKLLAKLQELGGTVVGRSALAKQLGCHPDTVTARAKRLHASGLITIEKKPGGRDTYKVCGSTVAAVCNHEQVVTVASPVTVPTSRMEAMKMLKPTIFNLFGLIFTVIAGAKRLNNHSETRSVGVTHRKPADNQLVLPLTPTKKPTSSFPYECPNPPVSTQPTEIRSPENQPVANIYTDTIHTTPSSPNHSSEPTNTNTNTGRALKKLTLGRGRKREEFSDPKVVEWAFKRTVDAGYCTVDERVHFFRFVEYLLATLDAKYSFAGTLLKCLRGEAGQDDWRARGSEFDHVAREKIRSLLPEEFRDRSSDLLGKESDHERNKHNQAAALKAKYGL